VNVSRWFDTILNQPKITEALKRATLEFAYCVTPVKFDPAKLKEIQGTYNFTDIAFFSGVESV